MLSHLANTHTAPESQEAQEKSNVDKKETECKFEMLSGLNLDNQAQLSGSAVLVGGQTPSLRWGGGMGEAVLGHGGTECIIIKTLLNKKTVFKGTRGLFP